MRAWSGRDDPIGKHTMEIGQRIGCRTVRWGCRGPMLSSTLNSYAQMHILNLNCSMIIQWCIILFTNELSLFWYAIVGHVRREEFIYKKTKHKWTLNGLDLKYMYRICFPQSLTSMPCNPQDSGSRKSHGEAPSLGWGQLHEKFLTPIITLIFGKKMTVSW
jgi:hypothetical protein